MSNMKALCLRVKNSLPMLKFFDGQTDGWTDRVITIGHPSSGRALIIFYVFKCLDWYNLEKVTKMFETF